MTMIGRQKINKLVQREQQYEQTDKKPEYEKYDEDVHKNGKIDNPRVVKLRIIIFVPKVF